MMRQLIDYWSIIIQPYHLVSFRYLLIALITFKQEAANIQLSQLQNR